MVNTAEFKKALIDANLTQRKLAELSGISKNALNRKINNKGEFTLSETSKVCECMGITEAAQKCNIFLA
jgi:transcriptional regulator with XRE-family HTH domain